MARTPKPEEFEIKADGGIVHKPTGICFVAFPARPTEGTWQDGHKEGTDYESEEVRAMMRHVLAKRLAK